MNYEIKFNDLFEFSDKDDVLNISGRAWKGMKIPNKKVILSNEKEILNITNSIRNVPIQCDHSKSVRDTVGKVLESKQDGDSVLYRGEVHDKEISDKIRNKLINQCSVGLKVDKVEEVNLDGDQWLSISGVKVIELSLVLAGAVEGNSVFPEFSFNIIENPDPVEPINYDYDQTVEDIARLAYEELKTKYDQVLDLIDETLYINSELNKQNKRFRIMYEFLLNTGEELPEKYADIDEELVLLYAEMLNIEKNNSNIKGVLADENSTPHSMKEKAKEDLKQLIFSKEKKKDIKTWEDFKKKYKNLEDYL